MVATNCYGARRLSDLLQEQQEPFLTLLEAPQRRRSPVEACKAATKALLRCDLAACFGFGFRCGAGARRRQRFRRLPRAGDIADRCGDDAPLEDCGRQLSPVSVMDLLHSDDEESPVVSHWDDDDSDVRTSTSPSSPPSDHNHLPGAASTPPCSTTFFVTSNGKKSAGLSLEEMERATVSGWERIAADIARIPTLVALDLSASAREWRRHVAGEAEEEAWQVGQTIEAMIFEEVRWDAVLDMILPA